MNFDNINCCSARQIAINSKELEDRKYEEKRQNDNCEKIININSEQLKSLNKIVEKVEYNNCIQNDQLLILRKILSDNNTYIQVEEQILKLLKDQYEPNHPIWQSVKTVGKESIISTLTEITITAIKKIMISNGIYL